MTYDALTRACGVAVLTLVVPAASADDFRFEARLSGSQEVVFDSSDMFVPGGVDTAAQGAATATFDRALSQVRVSLRVRDLTGGFTASHFHCGRAGQNGPVVFGLANPGPLSFDGERIRGNLTNKDYTGADCVPVVGRVVNNIASLAQAMKDGLIYINVHTDFAPTGEIRGQMLERQDDDGDDDVDDNFDDVDDDDRGPGNE